MADVIARKLPPGLIWAILCILSTVADYSGFANLGIYIQSPETAKLLDVLVTAIFALLAGASRGIKEDKEAKK
jgi:hypothetical protein